MFVCGWELDVVKVKHLDGLDNPATVHLPFNNEVGTDIGMTRGYRRSGVTNSVGPTFPLASGKSRRYLPR